MPSFDDFIVYVDESGDHNLKGVIDQAYPVFVLAFCLFSKHDYSHQFVPELLDFKFNFFGHDQIVLHEHEIRKQKAPFEFLRDAAIRESFMAGISSLVEKTPFTLIASLIDKNKLARSYADPHDPYRLAMTFCLERVYLHLHHLGCSSGRLPLVFEKRGEKEDKNLELAFLRACPNNATGQNLPFDIYFAKKASNSSGLQLADLVARPIGRNFLDSIQSNRAYEVIERKFRRRNDGHLEGWGLKIFP